ncbi:MAG: hypothetical protein MUF15_28485 [Acidobacteria bacterium]|nr:hypothetical protein [Acidobacteriota bacterium]
MNADGNKLKATEIRNSLEQLLPDKEGRHVVAIVELTFGILQHLIAYGMEMKYGRHLNSHIGLCKELRILGEDNTAQIFESLDTLRSGRWYGGKGYGNVVSKCIEYINEIEQWAQ